MADVLADVSRTLRELAKDKGLTLEVAGSADDIMIVTDRRALHQILINLTNNAIKYTESGFVRLELSRRAADGETWVDVSVVDSGIGIKSEDIDKLFSAFEQLDSSSTRRFEGVGLGLHLSQKLATLLGAELNVASRQGEGSTFTLSLPAAKPGRA
jgi:two-component system sensor histidine kinase/response regulator